MPKESAIDLKIRTDIHLAKARHKNRLVPRGPLQRANCWNSKMNTEFLDTMVNGFTSPPLYTIPRVSEDDNDDEDEDDTIEHHIFDGAHKFEAAANFIDNKYSVDPKAIFLSSLKDYIGKNFKELPRQIRDKITNYEFDINLIDETTANDPDALKILWLRLNKAGQPLNDFEIALPVINQLVKKVLQPSSKQFFNTEIFPKDESERGQIEKILQRIIAIAESNMTDYVVNTNSQKHLIMLWQDSSLGKKNDEINRRIEENSLKWNELLKKACQYLKFLSDAGTFVDDGTSILETGHRGLELVFLLGRLVHHFPNPAEFRRLGVRIGKKIKETYFRSIARDKAGRNSGFQRRVLKEIDTIVAEFTTLNCPRSFTKDQISQKYKDQSGICHLCKTNVQKGQESGDHILPWSMGGTSDLSNCQMTHLRCNKAKGDREDLTEFQAIPQ